MIASSCGIVGIPNSMMGIWGYGPVWMILLESFLLFAGFTILFTALVKPLPTWLNLKVAIPLMAFTYLLVPYILAGGGAVSSSNYIIGIVVILSSALILIVLAFFSLSYIKGKSYRLSVFYILFGALSLIWAYRFWYGSPTFPTDETTIILYSAHLFLNGANPYNPANTLNVFSYFKLGINGFPINLITPTSTGGYVTSLGYPALSFLIMIPAAVLGFPASATFIPVYVIPILLLIWGYRRKGQAMFGVLSASLLLLNPNYLSQIGVGLPDVLWVTFLFASLLLAEKPAWAGLFFGLALSVKQDPIFLAPFLLYFIYREYGRKSTVKWIASAVLAFAVVNAYFIALSPSQYLAAVLSPETQGLIGTGFGPAQFSFLGILPLAKESFTLAMACVMVASLIMYVAYYRKLRYAFLAFPIVIFMFNYRLFIEYIMYWPILALSIPAIIPPHEVESEQETKKLIATRKLNFRKIMVPVMVVILLSAPVAYQFTTAPSANPIMVKNVTIDQTSNGSITELSLVISLNTGKFGYNDLLFRIAPEGNLGQWNGLLWNISKLAPLSGGSENITIVPVEPSQEISVTGNYRIIAYYGYSYGAISLNTAS